MAAAVCALDIWLEAAEGCSMLQCALDMMACALGSRFTDWIMNRNFGFSDHNIICSVIMFTKCFWFIVHCFLFMV